MQWIPFTTALLSLAFAAYTLRLFIVKKENCLLMWSAALLFYGLACGMEFIIASGGINLLVYRLWYVTGAIFSAAYLAVGAPYSEVITYRQISDISTTAVSPWPMPAVSTSTRS